MVHHRWYRKDVQHDTCGQTQLYSSSQYPYKKEYGITYYSKLHVDFARNPGLQYAEDYYMVEQIMAKYHVDRGDCVWYCQIQKNPERQRRPVQSVS